MIEHSLTMVAVVAAAFGLLVYNQPRVLWKLARRVDMAASATSQWLRSRAVAKNHANRAYGRAHAWHTARNTGK